MVIIYNKQGFFGNLYQELCKSLNCITKIFLEIKNIANKAYFKIYKKANNNIKKDSQIKLRGKGALEKKAGQKQGQKELLEIENRIKEYNN